MLLKNQLNYYAVIMTFVFFPYIYAYLPLIENTTNIKSPIIIGLFYLSISIFGAISLLRNKKSILGFSPYIFLVVIATFSLLWSQEIIRGTVNIYLMLLAILMAYLINSTIGFTKSLKVFSYSILVFCMLFQSGILTSNLNTYNFDGNRFGYIEGDFSTDPNFLALWIGLGVIYFGVNITNKKYYYKIIPFSILLYFLFLTASRTAILSFSILILILFILKKRFIYSKFIFIYRKTVGKTLIISFIFSLIFLLFLNIKKLEYILNRFSLLGEDDRLIIWAISLKIIFQNFFTAIIGVGFGASDRAIGSLFEGAIINDQGIPYFSSHNIYIDWLLQVGVIGFLFFIIFLVWITKISYKFFINEQQYEPLLITLYIFIFGIGVNLFGNYSWPILFGLILSYALESNVGNIKGKNENLYK